MTKRRTLTRLPVIPEESKKKKHQRNKQNNQNLELENLWTDSCCSIGQFKIAIYLILLSYFLNHHVSNS